MKKFATGLLMVLLTASVLQARVMEGIDLPPTKTIEGRTLQLNGAGVRTFRFLGLPIKIYVAAFYTPQRLASPKEVMASSGPMQFDFTFLRDVTQQQVTEAWQKQMETSASFKYDGFEQDRDKFIGMFGALKSGGTETVKLVGENTVIIDQGVEKGTISGRNFQKAFLSIWFGEKAVSKELKNSLLGG